MSEEETIFHEKDVWVTNKRFITDQQTVAVSSITSVETQTQSSFPFLPLVLFVLGAFMILFGLIGLVTLSASSKYTGMVLGVFGASMISLGVRLTKTTKTHHQYFIHLTTSSGRVRILPGTDKEFIDRVVNALNRAIVLRS